MKNRTAILLITLLCFVFFSAPVSADKHSEKEVKELIRDVESKLDIVKQVGAENYAEREISKIEEYIQNAKRYLIEDEEDLAFYEIKKGKAYFKLIKVKFDKLQAESELKNVRSIR